MSIHYLEDCQLCLNMMDEPCTECEDSEITVQLTCNLVLTDCGHFFHQHCLESYLKEKETCPLDKELIESSLVFRPKLDGDGEIDYPKYPDNLLPYVGSLDEATGEQQAEERATIAKRMGKERRAILRRQLASQKTRQSVERGGHLASEYLTRLDLWKKFIRGQRIAHSRYLKRLRKEERERKMKEFRNALKRVEALIGQEAEFEDVEISKAKMLRKPHAKGKLRGRKALKEELLKEWGPRIRVSKKVHPTKKPHKKRYERERERTRETFDRDDRDKDPELEFWSTPKSTDKDVDTKDVDTTDGGMTDEDMGTTIDGADSGWIDEYVWTDDGWDTGESY